MQDAIAVVIGSVSIPRIYAPAQQMQGPWYAQNASICHNIFLAQRTQCQRYLHNSSHLSTNQVHILTAYPSNLPHAFPAISLPDPGQRKSRCAYFSLPHLHYPRSTAAPTPCYTPSLRALVIACGQCRAPLPSCARFAAVAFCNYATPTLGTFMTGSFAVDPLEHSKMQY